MKKLRLFQGPRRALAARREKIAPMQNAAFCSVFTAVSIIHLPREFPFSMVGNLLPFFWVDHRGRRSFPDLANDFDE